MAVLKWTFKYLTRKIVFKKFFFDAILTVISKFDSTKVFVHRSR